MGLSLLFEFALPYKGIRRQGRTIRGRFHIQHMQFVSTREKVAGEEGIRLKLLQRGRGFLPFVKKKPAFVFIISKKC
jgi:hypothetical protein